MSSAQLELLGSEWAPGDPRDSWGTPQRLFDELNAEYGPFSLDVAANDGNHKCREYLTVKDDALRCDWRRLDTPMRIWCNPPFSDIEPWVKKAWEESQRGAFVVMLLPANRTGRYWFQQWVIGKADEVVFLKGRVQYVPAPGIEPSSCAFDSMLVIYAPGKPDYDRGANTIIRGL